MEAVLTVSKYLRRGEENATPRRELVRYTGMKDRELRHQIRRERLAGVPILSNNSTGYYLPATPEEGQRFMRSETHRARETYSTVTAIEEGLKNEFPDFGW